MKKTNEVFGVSPGILADSYVDRGDLDEELQRLLARKTHLALKGESKCGKSWLRQKNIPNALTVQCRLRKGVPNIYVDALSQLGIKLIVQEHSGAKFSGKIEAAGEAGLKLLVKASGKIELGGEKEWSETSSPIGRTIDDLRFVAEIIKESGRRFVIEDFHYLSLQERKDFAFDLKALWDYELFVIVIGVWSQSNLLIFLNPDLTARIQEVSIYWANKDLYAVLKEGGSTLKLQFSPMVSKTLVENCFGNVGILQNLTLSTLDASKIYQECASPCIVSDLASAESACIVYADQLNALYQQFARRVSAGIRKRPDSTGIYAHAMAVIMDESDEALIRGVSLNSIYEKAYARQPRIQKGNLRSVLEKFEELQIDEDGRGLVISYSDATSELAVVDRQLLLYRRYCTVAWPWEQLVAESEQSSGGQPS